MGKEKEKQVICYSDPLNEEFSKAQIVPRVIDGKYPYSRGPVWEAFSTVIQNVLSMPVKLLYLKLKFRLRYVGKEKLKAYKNTGYFIYGNHTQPFADTFIPSIADYPKRNFFLVSPANVSMPGMGWLVELLGAIPIPGDLDAARHFVKRVEDRIRRHYSVTIYPEAHIRPYYTHIRPFTDVSFKYPVKCGCPVFALTNTYHRRGKRGGRVKIITYIDGPFFPDETLPPRQRQRALRDQVYRCMTERSRESDYERIEYREISRAPEKPAGEETGEQ